MSDPRLLGVLLCFALSGFAALLYQTVWTREFAFVFGTSELAVATVLAAYMGGLAGGAALAGRHAHRVRRPVLVYGLLELGIAAAALAVPLAVAGSTALHVAVFGGQESPPGSGGALQAAFYLVSSFAILAVPTGLMGATLPLLARYAVTEEREIGGRIGLLYATNTAGAVAGTLTAAFLLLPRLGQTRTVWVGAALNLVVFALAAALARARTEAPVARAEAVASTPVARAEAVAGAPPPAAADGTGRWILPLIALSGVCSFVYEVLWTRLLGHVLGGSAYAFATMLAAFLVGIAVGSALASRWARTRSGAARGFAVAQLGTAGLSLAAFAAADGLPELALRLGAGWQGGLLANAALSGAVLLPATLCIGATFPFAVRVLARSADEASAATARVYAWNTVGAIAGAIGAGFVLVPALGYAGALGAAVATNLLLALVSAWAASPRAPLLAAAAVAGALLLTLLPPRTPWRIVRSSPFERTPSEGEVRHYAVGRGATVLLLERPTDPGAWQLRTNGLPEATITARGGRAGRFVVNGWMPTLPVLLRPGTHELVVVGLGGGLALEDVPAEIERIDVIELEPEVVAANRAVADLRRSDPLADPRVNVHVNDARGSLLLTERRFDALVSQPSHPWTAGASHLYTREFFALVRDHLTPDGVFVQWIGLGFVDEPLLRSLVATLLDVFPHVQVYRPEPGALLFAASGAPLEPGRTAPEALAREPDLYARLGLHDAADVTRALVLDEAGARAFAAGAPVNRDDHNLFETVAPAELGRSALGAPGASRVLDAHDPLGSAARVDPVRDTRRLLAARLPERARRAAAAAGSPADRHAAEALLALAQGREDAAGALLGRALRAEPGHREARWALLRLRRRALGGGSARLEALVDALPDGPAAVVEGWRLQDAGREEGVAALDARLAAVPPDDPAHADALRLRMAWRRATGDPARAREGLELADRLLALEDDAADRVERAVLAAQAGYPRVSLSALAALAHGASRASGPAARVLAERVSGALERIEVPPALEDTRRRIRDSAERSSAGRPGAPGTPGS